MNNNLLKNIAIWLLIGFLVFLIIDFYKANDSSRKISPISYSNFLSEIKNGNVARVDIRGNNITGEYSNGSYLLKNNKYKNYKFYKLDISSKKIFDILKKHNNLYFKTLI